MQQLHAHQVEWLMEKNEMISKQEEAHQRIEYLTLLIQDKERQQQAAEQQINRYHQVMIQIEDTVKAEKMSWEQQV